MHQCSPFRPNSSIQNIEGECRLNRIRYKMLCVKLVTMVCLPHLEAGFLGNTYLCGIHRMKIALASTLSSQGFKQAMPQISFKTQRTVCILFTDLKKNAFETKKTFLEHRIVQYHAGVTEHLRYEAGTGHKILKKNTLLFYQTAFPLYEMLSSCPSLSTQWSLSMAPSLADSIAASYFLWDEYLGFLFPFICLGNLVQ